MMRHYLVTRNLAEGSLIGVLENFTVGADKLYVVYQKDKYQPARMKLFVDYLAGRARELLGETVETAMIRTSRPR